MCLPAHQPLGDQGRALQTVARSALRDVFAAVDANRSSARDRNRAPASIGGAHSLRHYQRHFDTVKKWTAT